MVNATYSLNKLQALNESRSTEALHNGRSVLVAIYKNGLSVSQYLSLVALHYSALRMNGANEPR